MKRWWFLSKAKKSCWKNIELWLIWNTKTVSLMGFVVEINYPLAERLMFFRKFRHNLNMESKNLIRSCHENKNICLVRHCQYGPDTLAFCFRRWENKWRKGSKEFWFSSGKPDKRQNTIQLNFLPTELYEGNLLKLERRVVGKRE